jgi:hypothetical protein
MIFCNNESEAEKTSLERKLSLVFTALSLGWRKKNFFKIDAEVFMAFNWIEFLLTVTILHRHKNWWCLKRLNYIAKNLILCFAVDVFFLIFERQMSACIKVTWNCSMICWQVQNETERKTKQIPSLIFYHQSTSFLYKPIYSICVLNRNFSWNFLFILSLLYKCFIVRPARTLHLCVFSSQLQDFSLSLFFSFWTHAGFSNWKTIFALGGFICVWRISAF